MLCLQGAASVLPSLVGRVLVTGGFCFSPHLGSGELLQQIATEIKVLGGGGVGEETSLPHKASLQEGLIKEPPGNAQLFRLARRDLFLKQEWTLPSSTVSKKVKQRRQTE